MGKTGLRDSPCSESVVPGHFDPLAEMVIPFYMLHLFRRLDRIISGFLQQKEDQLQQPWLPVLFQVLIPNIPIAAFLSAILFFYFSLTYFGKDLSFGSFGHRWYGKTFSIVLDVWRHSFGGYVVFVMFFFNLDFDSFDSLG